MFKRIGLFLLTNIAVIVVLSIVMFLIEKIFGINISGYAIGGNYTSLLIFAGIFGFGGAFISLFMSKWMAKRAYNITPLTKEEVSEYGEKYIAAYQIVEDIAINNGIKMPEFGIYESKDPNAFATGASKNNSLVALSTGLVESMDKGAIEGVMAHEMAHVLNGDMVTMTLLQGVINTFVIFISRILAGIVDNFISGDEESNGHSWTYMGISILFEMIFGVLASLITMKFSRYREFRADEGSARFVGKEKMIAGLQALKRFQTLAGGDDEKLATMKISTKKKSGFKALFSSHPDLDDRIKALEDLRI